RLYVAQTGQYVGKGQPIAEIYSPDLMTAQQEYLTALESSQALSRNSFAEIAQGARQLLQSAHSRLKLLGITEAQINRLNQTRRPLVDLTIYSPVSGTVTQKVAQLGQFVGQGQPLFQVADLSQVWVEAPIYEDQLASIRVGQAVDITAPAYPGKAFRGKIFFVSPVVDAQTRTVQTRIALPNALGRLKPEMFVEARIRVPLGSPLAVPASAVVDTGTRKVVWIERGSNAFVPREVRLGNRSGDFYPVLSGLSQGEKVAATGAYLIDSSSQMRSLGAGSMPGMDMGGK
ncbi:MAG TPA: efflux RND transporter periplasmic adaptor subunit, partial [Chroococcales cyanobacterium]